MNRVLSEVLEQLAPSAVVDVFASYGATYKEQPAPRPERNGPIVPKTMGGEAVVAGVVGFTGDTMRGTLLLAATFHVIANARPADLRKRPLSHDSASDWILVRDWAGELANQVLGRIKNRLHRYQVVFDVSPPTAFSGAALTFAAPRGPSPRHHVFTSGKDTIWFCFDALFDPVRRVSTDGAESEAAEGKVILF
jgi:chemotaxis protein CheX